MTHETPSVAPAGETKSTRLAILALWYRNAITRRALACADADTLRDIGIDEAARAAEVAKPFWK